MTGLNYTEDFSFYEQLNHFYLRNRGKIRSRYNDLTKKFLSYNDIEENPNAYLRRPQFEALEIYVFIKEFMGNPQVYEMFDDWRKRENKFSDKSYYSINEEGQLTAWDSATEKNMDTLFKQMKNYKEIYPNYIYSLTMGLGKTILMATCIFYEFLLANKYPKNDKFCHNALVFAPDKTVLQSLKEIMTFDKSLVVPPEYSRVLDANMKFHFLEETGATLQTIDGSDFNVIISNTQKIIVKKKRKKQNPGELLFDSGSLLSSVYGSEDNEDDDNPWDDSSLIDNQRFKKICRLPQLGVYVDEAHHLFGANLDKAIRKKTANKTSLRDTINMLADKTSIVACYNYTGTPYVNKQVLPEVVYAYGLKESIRNGYLKDANPIAYENVKNEEFLKSVINRFWDKYGNKTYEGLNPKLAIYASGIDEAVNEVRPAVEMILSELGISLDSILLNVGDNKYTKNEDIRNFNNLDIPGSIGNEKQFIILVDKGKEGWNCRSLFGVAMFRNPKSKIFVLQSTMRCLRKITDKRQTATVFLSKENYKILSDELNKNFNMEINDIRNKTKDDKLVYKVRVLPPPRKLSIKKIWHEYKIIEKAYNDPIDFKLSEIDLGIYKSKIYEKDSIVSSSTVKSREINDIKDRVKYSEFSLVGEIARYFNLSCLLIERILKESISGVNEIIRIVNEYNEILTDYIIPKIFNSLYEVKVDMHSEDRELTLLREPENLGYYEFRSKPELVLTSRNEEFSDEQKAKSFHADTYCFDSMPERECFLQYIKNENVTEIYFTGMFTSDQGEFAIQYFDPVSGRIRNYSPDFIARLSDGSYQIVEVKGDNKIDDLVVKAKAEAANELAIVSGINYKMYSGNKVMNSNILEYLK